MHVSFFEVPQVYPQCVQTLQTDLNPFSILSKRMKFKIYLFLKLITTLIPTAKFLLLLDPFQKALVCECVYRNVFKMHILNILNYRGIQEKNIGFGSLRGLLGVFCRSSCLVGGFCFGGVGLVWFWSWFSLSGTSEWAHSFSQSDNRCQLRKHHFVPPPRCPEVVITLRTHWASPLGPLDIFPSLLSHSPPGLPG